MSPTAEKIMWVIELLVNERPRTISDIVRSTGWHRRDVDDAVWELQQRGMIYQNPKSILVAHNQ